MKFNVISYFTNFPQEIEITAENESEAVSNWLEIMMTRFPCETPESLLSDIITVQTLRS